MTLYETPPEIAVALHYDGDKAPRITAKGKHKLAEEIIELARHHGVPLRTDPEMAAVLAQIPLGDEIPESLYRAIAEIIAFAYLITGKRPEGFDPNKTDEPEDIPCLASKKL
jgi:flagellar biosynthesis protein